MLNICMTADHELFSGENKASEEDIVIHPTYSLLKVLEQFEIPLCLMTDVCSLIRYRELEVDRSYVHLMEEQLLYAIRKGHDVQLHIHPHWLRSDYEDGKWKFQPSDFRLHSFGFEEAGRSGRQIIAEGKSYLESLLKPVNQAYECIAFRAGGWCLQPERAFLEALAAEGILIDATVYKGGFSRDENRFYDFRRVPDQPNWWIDSQQGLEYEASRAAGRLFEVTIGSYGWLPMLGLKKLMLKPYRQRVKGEAERPLGKSLEALVSRTKWQGLIDKVQRFFLQPILFEFDSACSEVMMSLLEYYLKRFDCVNKEFYICIIGHPKTLNKKSLGEIERFCETVTKNYSKVVRFISFRDIPLK